MQTLWYIGDTKKLFRDWYVQIMLFTTLILNLSLWALIYKRVEPTPDPVPLHYNIYFGINYVGEWQKIFIMPFVGIFIAFANTALSYFLYVKNKVSAYILITASMLSQGMLVYSLHLLTTYII